jgi:Zn-finger protein
MTFRQAIEAMWQCPYCPAKGKKWIKQREARKIARDHISKCHRLEKETNYKSIIIEKRRCENENTTKMHDMQKETEFERPCLS